MTILLIFKILTCQASFRNQFRVPKSQKMPANWGFCFNVICDVLEALIRVDSDSSDNGEDNFFLESIFAS